MTLIDAILAEMLDDDADRADQSRRLRALYHDATPEVRAALNDAMVCLCGWSMDRMLDAVPWNDE